jgi:cytochrome P450
MGGILGQSMIAVDEPDHRRLRGLVSKAFTPKYIQSLRPSIQKIADDLLDRVEDQGHMDLITDYAFPLPINVISDMLGVPSDGQDLIREWSELFSGDGAARQDDNRLMITQIFSDYLIQLIKEKRAHPQEDLISQLVQIEEAGDRLDENELISMMALLIFAGHETTSNLVGNGTLMLFDHPAQLQRLVADLSLVPAAVEEFLRFNGPVLSPAPRFAREDIELGGQQIRKGDMLLTVLGSANRDEKQFTQPEEMDIARSLNRHVAFGQGIHICLGAPLARLEGDIAFTTLLRRLPNLRLAIPRDAVTWRGNFSLHGINSLPVAF